MLSKTLRIVPLLALGAIVPNLQEARSTAVPVERVQPMHQDGEALAARQGEMNRRSPGITNRCTTPPGKRKRTGGSPVPAQGVPMSVV